MTIVRFAAIVFALTAATCPVIAKTSCASVLSNEQFEKRGGKLVIAVPPDLSNLPYNFFCDFVPCGGNLSVAAVAQKDGSVLVIGVDHNDWNNEPARHASILAERVAAMRFAPPRIDGVAVCVRFDEHLASNQYKAPRIIRHWP